MTVLLAAAPISPTGCGTTEAWVQPMGRFGVLPVPEGSPGVRLHSTASQGESGVNPEPLTCTASPLDRLVAGTTVTSGDGVIAGAKPRRTEVLSPSLSPMVSRQLSPAACCAAVGGQG